jgi:hypothetical protein
LATTLALGVLVTCAVRVVDARFAENLLPVAQLVVDVPCTKLTLGQTPHSLDASDQSQRCGMAGFLIGENADAYYLVQRVNKGKCREGTSVPSDLPSEVQSADPDDESPRLVIIPRADVEFAAVYAFECNRSDGGAR